MVNKLDFDKNEALQNEAANLSLKAPTAEKQICPKFGF
jgi:hypothetical protein